MHLQLVVADLHLEREAFEEARTDALPRLPGLECVLRHARRDAARQDWRAFIATLAGREDLLGRPPAAVVAAAHGLEQPERAWFATPVHLQPGLDHLRLHPAGVLRPDEPELRDLAAGFAAAFAGEGVRLHPVERGFLLLGLEPTDAATEDPARYLGADLRGAPARGPGAARLRRLGAEIEMWLHARGSPPAGRGLPINALWVWGGGRTASLPGDWRGTGVPRWQAHAEDAYAAALWRLAGRAVTAPPADLASFAGLDGTGRDAAHLVCLHALAERPGDNPLARLDRDWLQPGVEALRAGRLQSFAVQVGAYQHHLTRSRLWGPWRRRRPWWEGLAR
jgi:hypothetical protein